MGLFADCFPSARRIEDGCGPTGVRDRAMSGVQCPTCGDEFGSERAMKVHHTHAHNESIAEKPLSERYAGNIECPTCGREGFQSQYGVKQHRSQTHNEDVELTPNADCDNCGSEFYVRPCRRKRHDNLFCSPECSQEFHQGENNQNYRHGEWVDGRRPDYGPGWTKERREAVRSRQDRLCAGCGKHEQRCSRKLHVHHIQKAGSFDDPEKRNAMSNLVALWNSCHTQWERMSPLRPETPHLNEQ